MGGKNSQPETVDNKVKVAEYPDATLVKVTNIPADTATQDDVKTLLKDCGTILEMSRFSGTTRTYPPTHQYILVTFKTKAEADHAVALQNPKLADNDIVVELAETDGYIPKEMEYISQKLEIAKYGYWVSQPIHK
mmetsp:Transcript_5324/g.8742  ORF Transcript_5324/g.8742 Transcript_5324/m.8742 type:complete len:135 (+) Transcript_5324:56-460(+)